MVELGDLREGIMPSDLDNTIEQVIGLEGLNLLVLEQIWPVLEGLNLTMKKWNICLQLLEMLKKSLD